MVRNNAKYFGGFIGSAGEDGIVKNSYVVIVTNGDNMNHEKTFRKTVYGYIAQICNGANFENCFACIPDVHKDVEDYSTTYEAGSIYSSHIYNFDNFEKYLEMKNDSGLPLPYWNQSPEAWNISDEDWLTLK